MIVSKVRLYATGAFFVLGVSTLTACSAGTAVVPGAGPAPATAATPAGGRADEIAQGLSPLLCGAGFCNDRRPAPTTEPYVIRRDGGGQIISAEADRKMLLDWGGRVEIRERCSSACVIFTTLPNACLGPGLRIGFHSADVNRSFVGNRQIAGYLRGDVKRRFLEEWQNVPNDQIHYITARAYKRLDPQVRICDQD